MEPRRPLLALPIGTAWADRGADIPRQREIAEEDFNVVWNKLWNAYHRGEPGVCDVYALIDFLHERQFSTPGYIILIENPVIVDVLRALKAHGDAAGDANTPGNAWRVWGGPPDDDRWWANLWKARDEWEDKRDQYVAEQRRDYGKAYKRFHINYMHSLFGSYDFKRDETIDAFKVGARTYTLVTDLLTKFATEIAAAEAARPVNDLRIGIPSPYMMSEESYRMYKARSAPLSEMTVLGERVWQHYDVPRNRHSYMLLLGFNMPYPF